MSHDADVPPTSTALPVDSERWCCTTAAVTQVGGHRLLVLPVAAPVGVSRGRRYLVVIGDDGAPHQRVVLSVAGRAAVVPPDDLPTTVTQVTLRLRALPPRRRPRVPADLRDLLAADGLRVNAVPEPERTQLIRMINESATPQVRAARLDAARQIAAVWSRRVHRG